MTNATEEAIDAAFDHGFKVLLVITDNRGTRVEPYRTLKLAERAKLVLVGQDCMVTMHKIG